MHSSKEQRLADGFVKSQNLDYKPAVVVVTNVFGDRFRIDVAKNVDTGLAFISSRISWLQGDSYFVKIDEESEEVTDLTLGKMSKADKQAILEVSRKGIKS